MLSDAELKLRQVAVLLTVLLVVVGLWGIVRLLLLSEPEPVLPAPSSLRVGELGVETPKEELPPDFVTRPAFFYGRMAYVAPPRMDDEPEPEPPARYSELDNVKLVGMFGTGANATAIISQKGKARRLKLNESIEGWTFTFFSPDGAFFEKDMESRALKIEHAVSSAPARPAAGSRNRNASGASQSRGRGIAGLFDGDTSSDSKTSKASEKNGEKDRKVKKKKNKKKSNESKKGEK